MTDPVLTPLQFFSDSLIDTATSGLQSVHEGGPVMWVLLGFSLLSVSLIFLKLLQFASLGIDRQTLITRALREWQALRPDQALHLLKKTPNPIARVLEAAITGLGQPHSSEALVREEVARVAANQIQLLNRYLRSLDTIATLAPLLGLLGTVLGMIEAFRVLEATGGRADPAQLAGGIWVAMLTTAFGLAIAIPTSAALHWLEGIVERTHHAMEDAVTQVFTRALYTPLPAPAEASTAAASVGTPATEWAKRLDHAH